MYGAARMMQCFTEDRKSYTAALVCEKLYADVKQFTQGAPASDDITIMAVRFTGPLNDD
jgi:serine phosphatase RsbU (regulator of sigma subunit)